MIIFTKKLRMKGCQPENNKFSKKWNTKEHTSLNKLFDCGDPFGLVFLNIALEK